jgi:hypothetical protein
MSAMGMPMLSVGSRAAAVSPDRLTYPAKVMPGSVFKFSLIFSRSAPTRAASVPMSRSGSMERLVPSGPVG